MKRELQLQERQYYEDFESYEQDSLRNVANVEQEGKHAMPMVTDNAGNRVVRQTQVPVVAGALNQQQKTSVKFKDNGTT